MKKYKVSFYFGMWKANPFVLPSKEVEIEADENLAENEKILLALKELGTYPKTYSASVKEIN